MLSTAALQHYNQGQSRHPFKWSRPYEILLKAVDAGVMAVEDKHFSTVILRVIGGWWCR